MGSELGDGRSEGWLGNLGWRAPLKLKKKKKTPNRQQLHLAKSISFSTLHEHNYYYDDEIQESLHDDDDDDDDAFLYLKKKRKKSTIILQLSFHPLKIYSTLLKTLG